MECVNQKTKSPTGLTEYPIYLFPYAISINSTFEYLWKSNHDRLHRTIQILYKNYLEIKSLNEITLII